MTLRVWGVTGVESVYVKRGLKLPLSIGVPLNVSVPLSASPAGSTLPVCADV